jgi:hypothetical protein
MSTQACAWRIKIAGIPRSSATELGVQVLEVCRERGLAVPEDVALVGIDDDVIVLCNLFKAAHGMSPTQYRTAARPWEG